MDENDATDNLNLETIVNANKCHCKVVGVMQIIMHTQYFI